MKKIPFAGPAAKFVLSLAVVALMLFGVGGCSWFGEDEQAPSDTAVSEPAMVIEPIEGMKYYVGGPVMQADAYGRMRVRSFSGEVRKPTSRGLVIGHKELEDNRFEIRTWLNGAPVTKQYGVVRDDGLFWYDERSTLNSEGVVVARQTLTYDEDKKIIHSVLEYIDPADGEVLRTHETDLPYAPEGGNDLFEDDEAEEMDPVDEEGEGDEGKE